MTCSVLGDGVLLSEGWQLDQIALRHLFYRLAGFAPGGQASDDDEGAETVLP